jgi:hypothetical protein
MFTRRNFREPRKTQGHLLMLGLRPWRVSHLLAIMWRKTRVTTRKCKDVVTFRKRPISIYIQLAMSAWVWWPITMHHAPTLRSQCAFETKKDKDLKRIRPTDEITLSLFAIYIYIYISTSPFYDLATIVRAEWVSPRNNSSSTSARHIHSSTEPRGQFPYSIAEPAARIIRRARYDVLYRNRMLPSPKNSRSGVGTVVLTSKSRNTAYEKTFIVRLLSLIYLRCQPFCLHWNLIFGLVVTY